MSIAVDTTAADAATLAMIVGLHEQKAVDLRWLTMAAYLADWRHAITHGKTITSLPWAFEYDGLITEYVDDAVRRHPALFALSTRSNAYGTLVVTVRLAAGAASGSLALDNGERETIRYVCHALQKKDFAALLWMVESTYPAVNSQRFEPLDLPALAKLFKNAS